MATQANYGGLYESELFSEIFPNFKESQESAAEILWNRVFARCGVDPGMPKVNFIVDLGCGSGVLTAAIAKLAADADIKVPKHAKNIHTIGVDCSDDAIKLARANSAKAGSSCDFRVSTCSLKELFQSLKVPWASTALVCLSHTWFHFDQTEILEAVNKHRPALLLIDIFDTWDTAIKKVRAGEEELEEGRRGKAHDTYYFLKTTRLQGGSETKMIERGIWKIAQKERAGGEWMFREFGFPTKQYDRLTTELFGSELKFDQTSNEPPETILRTARTQGDLTGEGDRQCDYIVRKVVPHTGGWGRMRCHVLVSRDQPAKQINKAFFETIRGAVRQLFVEDVSKGEIPYKYLRDLLALFDEPKGSREETGFPGSREALILLPFDQHTAFGRMVGLFKDARDEQISSHDLIVECANPWQHRFPTAFGAFHTLEDRVSSPQAFPLDWATDYDHSAVDRAFGQLENALLGLTEEQTDGSLGYFMLPVYFGSLPLFSLALKYPVLFNVRSTGFDVYFSTLSNLLQAIKVALTNDFIKYQIMRPWISATFANPLAQIGGDVMIADPVTNHLTTIEQMLFGSQRAAPVNAASSSFENREGGVLNKDWKSWLMGIPSYPIKNLRVVKAENERLWKIWEWEREHFQMDHALRLSVWFQEGRFFEEGHECFDKKLHLSALSEMLKHVGFDGVEGAEGMPPVQTLADLCCNKGDNDRARGYFSSTLDHFLFPWMCGKLLVLVSGNENEQQEAFLDLKAVFCKSLANRGPRVRFGCRRLFCLLEAAQNGKSPEGEKPTIRDLKYFDARCWSVKDPSMDLADFVHSLRCLDVNGQSNLETVRVPWCKSVSDPTRVEIRLHVKLLETMGGNECDSIVRAYGKVSEFEADGPKGPYRTAFEFILDGKVDSTTGLKLDRI